MFGTKETTFPNDLCNCQLSTGQQRSLEEVGRPEKSTRLHAPSLVADSL